MLPERKSCGASPPCQECRKPSCNGWGWGLIYTGSLKFRIWRVDRANGELHGVFSPYVGMEKVYTLHWSVRSRGGADTLRRSTREGIHHMAQGVLLLGVTCG